MIRFLMEKVWSLAYLDDPVNFRASIYGVVENDSRRSGKRSGNFARIV